MVNNLSSKYFLRLSQTNLSAMLATEFLMCVWKDGGWVWGIEQYSLPQNL